jgi:spore germination cell wall hydrolase CwlJ-like protein
MAAVASVIRNRLAAGGYGRNPSEIVHAPNQFEPWISQSAIRGGMIPARKFVFRNGW